MKYLLTFIAGVCVGFIVAFYIEVLSKPVLPTFDYRRMARTMMGTPIKPVILYQDYEKPSGTLDDTQPVKVKQE
jgi:hypothetical protein